MASCWPRLPFCERERFPIDICIADKTVGKDWLSSEHCGEREARLIAVRTNKANEVALWVGPLLRAEASLKDRTQRVPLSVESTNAVERVCRDRDRASRT